ncbi:alpha/beta hydrolase fold-3 domain protein [Xylogone sp. PMI_703]|nr:alpha/beta hydrolase fold-3 domain protein [Xylogone sp. PMI_703]
MSVTEAVQKLRLSNTDREWENFYRSHPERIRSLIGTPTEIREAVTEMRQARETEVSTIENGVEVTEIEIPGQEGVRIRLRVYFHSKGGAEGSMKIPIVLYFHGGGWMVGNLESEDLTCRSLCVKGPVVVVNVDYRLAPEYPFPAAIDDALHSLQWVLTTTDLPLGADNSRIILAGTSAGANIGMVLSQLAVKSGIGINSIRGQILRIPVTCHPDHFLGTVSGSLISATTSLVQFSDAPLLKRQSMDIFYSAYSSPNTADFRVSPLLGDGFEKLPPAFFQIAGRDPLRDEGLEYARKLEEAGVPVKVVVYPGLPHAFSYFPLSATKEYGEDVITGLHWLLQRL